MSVVQKRHSTVKFLTCENYWLYGTDITTYPMCDCDCFIGISYGNLPIGGSDILVSVQPHCGQAHIQEVACMLLEHPFNNLFSP